MHGFSKIPTGEMNDEMINAAAMDLCGRVDHVQRTTGRQSMQNHYRKADPQSVNDSPSAQGEGDTVIGRFVQIVFG